MKNRSTRDTKIKALKIANKSFNFTTILADVIIKSYKHPVYSDQIKLQK